MMQVLKECGTRITLYLFVVVVVVVVVVVAFVFYFRGDRSCDISGLI